MVDISICMVSYNHADYIKQAIDSIFSQKTEYTYEIIVGDDASPDGTAQLVRDLYGDKVILLAHEKNQGLTRNMYEILQRCQGRYIYTCAGDDWICDENMLQEHVAFLDNNPEFSSVTNWRMTVDINGNKICDGNVDNEEFTIRDLLLKREIPDCGMGTIRNYFKDNKEDLSFLYLCSRNNEELPLSIYIYGKGKHKILPKNMIAYRYVAQEGKANYNSTHNVVQKFAESFNCIQNLKKYYPKYNYVGMETRYVYMYTYPVFRTFNRNQIQQFLKLIGCKWMLRMIWLGPIMFFNKKELPGFIVKEID